MAGDQEEKESKVSIVGKEAFENFFFFFVAVLKGLLCARVYYE